MTGHGIVHEWPLIFLLAPDAGVGAGGAGFQAGAAAARFAADASASPSAWILRTKKTKQQNAQRCAQ